MRIAVAATPALSIPALETLHRDHEISFVLTQPDRPSGRGRSLRESEVAQWAHTQGLPVFKDLHSCHLLPTVDLVVTVAYGVLIPKDVLRLPKHGFINLHYSLLPRWRGAAPVQRALMAGDKKTGVTVFQLDAGMDTGPIYVQQEIEIDEQWRAQELFVALNEIGAESILKAIELIEDGTSPVVQEGESCLAPKIAKSEFHINFSQEAEELRNLVRGLFPSAYMTYLSQRIKVLAATRGPAQTGVTGEVSALDPLTVSCGNGSSLIIERVLPEGKREMSAAEWVRGSRLDIGARFE